MERGDVKHRCGFTLLEVMIAVVVMAVIAGLAIPSYFQTVEQARSGEATTNLNIIHMGQKIYRLNHPTFWNGGASPPIGTINNTLGVDLPPPPTNYNVAFINGNANGYSARLIRNGNNGGRGSKFYQYDYSIANPANPVLTSSEGGAF